MSGAPESTATPAHAFAWMDLGDVVLSMNAGCITKVAAHTSLLEHDAVVDLAALFACDVASGDRYAVCAQVAQQPTWLLVGAHVSFASGTQLTRHELPALVLEHCRGLGIASLLEKDGRLAFVIDPQQLPHRRSDAEERGDGST